MKLKIKFEMNITVTVRYIDYTPAYFILYHQVAYITTSPKKCSKSLSIYLCLISIDENL